MGPKNPEAIWRPSEKQAQFLAAPEDEVLFGGSAGGGKSEALIVDALGLQSRAVAWSRYRALLIRQTTPQLRELIDRTRVMYPQVVTGADYSEQAKEWRFPSGAKVIFGYAERDSDVHQYQGQEYQWIGIDELGHFHTPYVWDYLSSRLRSINADVPVYMRATCNPGPKWIRERWGFSERGEASTKTIEVDGRVFTRRFIPSRVDDNPFLKDTGYKQRLMQLPAQERAALLEGRWDVVDVPGAIFGDQLKDAREAGRIRSVPAQPEAPVHTVWDLGVGDATAIWLWQVIGSEIHCVGYIEDSGEGMPYYIERVKDWATRRHVALGEHWAPHDIAVREFSSGLSRIETARSHGIDFKIVPRASVEDGIHAARMIFARTYFDEAECRAGVEALTNYRRDYNMRLGEYKADPVHDWSSHGCFVGDTLVLTRYGTRRIMDLSDNDEVLTPCGFKRCTRAVLTKKSAPLVEVRFSDGLTVKCTPEHLFLTASGWKCAESLPPSTVIQSTLTRSRSISMAACTALGRLMSICRGAARSCIGTFGDAHSGRFRGDVTFTIVTATYSTTALTTWSACLPANIFRIRGTSASGQRTVGLAKARATALQTGTPHQQAVCGTVATPSAPGHGRSGSASESLACSVVSRLMRWYVTGHKAVSIAHKIAGLLHFARGAEPRIASVRHLKYVADVWDITVPHASCFSLANGAVVHNSDAFRYLALAHPGDVNWRPLKQPVLKRI